ncbi:uncharacterized protein LOC128713066 [Anopheles marshallii]|uniref:uncharacterized protein LOC128713066 n=1 Tax=Anopheles marshallii TaxID=1521116 RepID=UPI00237C465E|nr:uncharacterized protein LOC128713066 [Anopheles marshallii]
MTRSYCWFALVSTLLLLLQHTLGELQRSSTAKPIAKARGGSSAQADDRTERIRAQLAGGFIDDAMVHKNGASQRHAYHNAGHQRPNVAGSERKMSAVHGTSGPIHTYIKTDKNANFKWGVRHFVGAKYAH